MKKIGRCFLLITSVLALVPVAFAETPSTSSSDTVTANISERADRILRQMSDYLSDAN